MYKACGFIFVAVVLVGSASASCGLGLGLADWPLSDGLPLRAGCFGAGPLELGLPRTIANTCRCTKTVLRPNYVPIVKEIPSIQRVIQNIPAPFLEQQHYTTVDGPSSCGLNINRRVFNDGVSVLGGDIVAPLPCGGF